MGVFRSDQSRLSVASEAGLGGYLDYISAVDDAGAWTALINLTAGLLAGSRSVTFDGASGGTLTVNSYIQLGTSASGSSEIRRIVVAPPAGTHNGAGNAVSLTDTTKNFVSLGVVVGDTLQNVTDASSTTITAITTTTNPNDTLVGVLAGGVENDWDVADVYRLTSGIFYIDQPTGFFHANNDTLDEKSATLTGLAGTSLVTFLPGVYESVTVPDMIPQIEPHYFLGTASRRDWTVAYRGRQAFSGSLPNFILLNSYPLRFPIGTVATTGTDVGGGGGSTITGAHGKGQRSILVTNGNLYDNGDFIQIGTGTTAEVRQIISGAGADGLAETFILNYPLMFAHATLEALNEVTSPYTHTISESVILDSTTWHLLLRDSGETAANDFIRRYIGGKVNRASIRADEGNTLMMSWDEVPFIDLVHNQRFHSSVGAGATDITKYAGAMIAPSGIGGAIPHSGGVLGTPTFSTNEPYYFSQSSLTFFGVTFARIRSFSLEINNNIEPRYYLRDTASGRIPAELQEQRREYRMTARVALPDSAAAATSTARTLFKELLLEGNYGSGMVGFDVSLVFTRSASDTITFTIPPSAAATGIDAQGTFVVRGAHNIGGESPTEVDLDMIFRSISVVSVDSTGVVP